MLRVYCDIYKNSCNISSISFLSLTASIILLYPSSPIPGRVSAGLIFPIYIQVYTVFAPYSPFYTFSPHDSPSHCTNSSDRTCSALLFSSFVKKINKRLFVESRG
jgi:hypothetical protein